MLLCGLLPVPLVLAAASEPVADPNQVKAAFIYNFTKYIHFPDGMMANEEGVFGVCARDPDTLGGYLGEMDNLITGELTIRVYQPVLEATEISRLCQVWFVNSPELKEASAVLNTLEDLAVLTITDSSEPGVSGINIQLIIRDNKVRFRIDPANLARKELKGDAALLNLGLRD